MPVRDGNGAVTRIDAPGRLRALVCVACVLLRCTDGKTRRHEYIDSGSLCLRAGADRLLAEVRLLECLSSSCNEQLSAMCSISQQGTAINVTSRMLLGLNGANTCATDCGSWIGRCELPMPAAGEYTLAFGAAHTSLRLPLVMDIELVPDGSTHGCLPIDL